MEIHWHILDKNRQAILPHFKEIYDEGFYLAGGTGLALLIGHRNSRDFDFFKQIDRYDTADLSGKLESAFKEHKISPIQSKNTVKCKVDSIDLSFFNYNYKLLKPVIKTEYFDIASFEDIACMKLISATQRTVERDYIDLYFILQKMPLKKLMPMCREKYPVFDEGNVLRGLTYIGDVEREEHKITYFGEKAPLLEKINKHFNKLVKEYIRYRQLEILRQRKQQEQNKERDIDP